MNSIAKKIVEGRCCLGIEFGSTRIKGILIDDNREVIASGVYCWENKLENNIWTYSKEDILTGLKLCYKSLKTDVEEKYNITIKKIASIGISAMMHGYIALDKKDEFLVPFRTWRNTITAEAQEKLTKEFNYPIPQRWSIAHLYQAILNNESHVRDIHYLTTLSGYVHYLLTNEKVLGIGDASGMFPIDTSKKTYNEEMVEKFNGLVENNVEWKLETILPTIKLAGEQAGMLTKEGCKLMDEDEDLISGIPFCAPEGDAGTGMVATNSIKKKTGNVSAGTSVFSMVVLEKELTSVYKEIDLVTTPQGDLVAMVHCNNCTSDLNAWINIFKQYNDLFGVEISEEELFSKLFNLSLLGDENCGDIVPYNYYSGEEITNCDSGRPLLIRKPDGKFNLANFIKANIYSCFATLKLGMDILEEEKIQIDSLFAHGGIFKTKEIAQSILASALNAPICVSDSVSEGGAYGIALLASYVLNTDKYLSLDKYLDEAVFKDVNLYTIYPKKEQVDSYESFIENYKKCLSVEKESIYRF